MDPTQLTARRANLEDLSTLTGLWQIAQLPASELEKHLTEFQLAVRPDGVVVGALALRIVDQQGLIHSEAFYSPAQAREARSTLWERLQVLARNRGLTRFWLAGSIDPFWQSLGFAPPDGQALSRLPQVLGRAGAHWWTLALHAEALEDERVVQQLELIQQEQMDASERIRQHGRVLKWIAALIAIAFFAGSLWLLFKLGGRRVRRRPE